MSSGGGRARGRVREVASSAAATVLGLGIATGSAAAHDWGTRNRTEAEAVLAGARVNESAALSAREGGRVAAAANDAGLLPGVSGPVEWALFAFVGLLAAILAFGLLVAVAKLTYGIVTGTAGWLSRAAGVLPLSEGQVRVAVVAMLAMGAVMFVGVEVQNNTTSLWDSEEGPAGQANDLKEQGLDGDVIQSLEADGIIRGETYSGPAYERPTPDADGDRLKDSWEERGVTPSGVPLPDADPDRKDIYVVVTYGANVSAYTEAEKRALRESWARMPVDNPDGTEGVTLHLVDSERLETTPTFDSGRFGAIYRERLDGPRCGVYHQVAVGHVGRGNTIGIGDVPGYATVVEGSRARFNGSETTRRVHVTNHELLHNVVGVLPNGGTHTTEGWLVPAVQPDEDSLSPAAESVLDEGLTGSGYYQNQVCAEETPTGTAAG
jgi:hypothetical protein